MQWFWWSKLIINVNNLHIQAHLPKGKVVNSYGLTEIGGPVTYTDREHGFKNGACGKIIPYIQYKVAIC